VPLIWRVIGIMFVQRLLKNAGRVVVQGRSRAAGTYTHWPMLQEEHVMIAEMAKNFADTELMPIASKIDKEHWFPVDAIQKLGEQGMMGICVDPEYGGAGVYTYTHKHTHTHLHPHPPNTHFTIPSHHAQAWTQCATPSPWRRSRVAAPQPESS
jgi:alkylation response protein AidB-like acyl-CoA dehydrogenase